MNKLLMVLTLIVLAASVLLLASCESPAAQRARARADEALAEARMILAEADAYKIKRQADMDAAAEREAIRQSAREASHQRALEMLPYVMMTGGLIVVTILIALIFWDVRRQSMQYTAERDRQLCRYIVEELSKRGKYD